MKCRASLAVLTVVGLLAVIPLIAQGPKGWLVRADRSTNATDPDAAGSIKFTAAGTGFHAITPQAAVFWDPANTVTGNYSLKGTFTLMKPSSHTNYYGLVFGGSDLGGPRQTYLYFLVAQDGTWLLKRREGDASTQDVAPRAVNAAVKRPDAKGQSVNALEVQVTGDKVQFLVNGAVVHTMPKSGLAKTDGLYGIRVNHALEVQVDGFALAKS
jgi:hypothetical protein